LKCAEENAGGTGGAGSAPPVFSFLPAGSWPVADAVDSVRLDFDQRHRRRCLLHTESGQEVLLDLPTAVRLRQDDGLVLPDGGIVRVCARPEPLLEISAPDPHLLMRVAWHLGNRHLPVQFAGPHVRIRADQVIADMVQGLGCEARPIEAPFDPEAGAYAAGAHHHHGAHD
jgi:urease accessory protein